MSGSRWETLQALDGAARRLAQTEFARPVVIEAGAGTGKTATLVARVVAWSLGPGWELAAAELKAEPSGRDITPEGTAARVLGGVVAITFTEAAAGEMADRIGWTLARVAEGSRPEWLLPEVVEPLGSAGRERAGHLLANLDRLVVSTIHAYCRRLLTTFPLEAGLHPDLTVDAEGDLLEEVVRDVVVDATPRCLGASPDPDWVELAVTGFGPRELAACLQELATSGVPPEALGEDRLPPSWRQEAAARLISAASAMAAIVGGRLEGGGRVDTARAVLEAVGATVALGRQDTSSTPEAFDRLCGRLRDIWTKPVLDRLEKWSENDLGATESKALGDAVGAVPAAAASLMEAVSRLVDLQPLLLSRAARVMFPLLSRVHQRLRATGVVTFNDLLRGAAALVRANPEVARRWRRDIRQLLVDEFQDIDRLQCELVTALALAGPPDERPGLFLVGDPKQSIYGWRNADLAAYHGFVGRVTAEAGGVRGELAVSFRSTPVLLGAVEAWMRPHMTEVPGVQAGFQPLAPCPANAGDEGFRQGRWAPLELWVSSRQPPADAEAAPTSTRSLDATVLEAEVLAADLVALHAEAGVPWSEVGILVRSSGDLDHYLAALRSAGVPFVVERDRSYYQRREILDATALVRAVVDPTDHVALVAWLRCPAVGVPDAAWLPLWRRRFPELVTALRQPLPACLDALGALVDEAVSAIPAGVPGLERIGGWGGILKVALRHLAELRESFATEPAVRFVERLRTLTLLEATASARYLGRFRVANLRRFFRRLAASLEAGTGDPQAVLRLLRRAVREEREEEEAHPTASLEEAVRVLTIHRAKGLDFTHVYLLQTHKGSRRDTPPRDAAWEGVSGWELRLLGAPTPGWRELQQRQRTVAEMELVRTLYVAMTRAKRRLVIAGNWPVPGKKAVTGSHMALLAAAGALPDPGEDGTTDTALGRFVWLDHRTGAAPTPARTAPELSVERVARARLDVEALVAARQVAAEHMARPFGRAASAEAHAALERVLADRQREESEGGWRKSPGTPGDTRATLVGAAVHRALETLPLDRPAAAAVRGMDGALDAWVRWHAPAEAAEDVLTEARAVLTSFGDSELARRWDTIARHVLGREVPLLVPPAGCEAVGYLSGQIDLLYRDPADGGLVVVDYKTDHVSADEALLARAAAYASQCRTYAQGVREAFGLVEWPRWELWFLRPGRVVLGYLDRDDLRLE